jgi:AraC-like DNA-binding protein
MVFSAVNQMDTLGEGLRRFAELASVIPSGLSVSLASSATCVKINYGVGEDALDLERAERYAELMAVVFHCVLLWGTNHPLRPRCVKLSERLDDQDGSMADSLTSYRCRVGLGTTVTYNRDDMNLPLGVRRYKSWASHETAMFHSMIGGSAAQREFVREPAFPVVTKLRQMLSQDNISQQSAAREMGMSVATLQRRLAESGHSFREISRDVRCSKLRSLLMTDCSLNDIALELGFSERRSLWRACQEWLGMSPAAYRRRMGIR